LLALAAYTEASHWGIATQTGLGFLGNGACAAAKLWQHGSAGAVDIIGK
jgi:hypothetical protein